MTACEACVIACHACSTGLRTSDLYVAPPVFEASVCMQACELAVRAMETGGSMVRAACMACARTCEAFALDCMLLGRPEHRRCAKACYRAARECRRVAAAASGRQRPAAAVAAAARGLDAQPA